MGVIARPLHCMCLCRGGPLSTGNILIQFMSSVSYPHLTFLYAIFRQTFARISYFFTNLFTAPSLTNSMLCNIRYLINDINKIHTHWLKMYTVFLPHVSVCCTPSSGTDYVFLTQNYLLFTPLWSIYLRNSGERQTNPITGLDRPWGFQEFEAPRFYDNWHM